jgi:DNA adenine methylase
MTTPFLKWVGGKRQVLPELLPRLPATFNAYWEPFVGGGALFFELSARLHAEGHAVHLSDLNDALVTTYQVVQTRLPELVVALQTHALQHNQGDKAHYYSVRAQKPVDPVAVAARFIYLNRTCFNGLWRVNKSGGFNVPMGAYKNPGIAQVEMLTQASTALQHIAIAHRPYQEIQPQSGDFVYFDPPYDPLTKTASFTAYSKDKFGDEAQIALRDKVDQLTQQGVRVMLSNSNTPLIQSLYKHYAVDVIQVGRAIAASASSRSAVQEVIVCNY